MRTVELDQATQSLAECAQAVGTEPLVVTQNGKPLAVLLPLDNADLETVSLSSNPRFVELIERSRNRLAQEGGLSSEEVRRQL
ncbi:MAG: type II toxin-antitoxin system Phd/YefM family antitoxin, partial [Bryobacteraceae bacterium]